jgi:chromosome segregation ATPase
MTLYELTGEFQELLRMAEDPEVDELTLQDTLEAVNMEIEDKADAYAKVMQELDADAEKISKEIDRLTKIENTIENNKTRIKTQLKSSMEACGKTKFKTDLFSFNIAKNGGKAPLSIDVDVDELPDDMCRLERKPDTQAIREYVEKNGGQVPFAHLCERGTSLRIK